MICSSSNGELEQSGSHGFWQGQLELAQQAMRGPDSTVDIAELYARLGDRDRSFALLERAFALRLFAMLFLNVDPPFFSCCIGSVVGRIAEHPSAKFDPACDAHGQYPNHPSAHHMLTIQRLGLAQSVDCTYTACMSCASELHLPVCAPLRWRRHASAPE